MKRLKPATSHCKKPAWIVEDNLLVWNQVQPGEYGRDRPSVRTDLPESRSRGFFKKADLKLGSNCLS